MPKKLIQKKAGGRPRGAKNGSPDTIAHLDMKAAFAAWQDRKGMPRDVPRKPYFKTGNK